MVSVPGTELPSRACVATGAKGPEGSWQALGAAFLPGLSCRLVGAFTFVGRT